MTDYNLTVVSDEDDYLRVDYGVTAATPLVPIANPVVATNTQIVQDQTWSPQSGRLSPINDPVGGLISTKSVEINPPTDPARGVISTDLTTSATSATSLSSLDSLVSLDPPATDMTILAVSETVRYDREVLLKRFLTLLTEDGGAWSHWYDQLSLVELYQDGNFVLSYSQSSQPTSQTRQDQATLLIYQDYIQYHDYSQVDNKAAGNPGGDPSGIPSGIIFFSDHLQSYGKTAMAQQTGLPGTSLEITEKFNIAATIMKTLAIPVT